ncbi:LOW QUALITY PROTEIN: probable E3 ubiquitin-protein ligase HERC4 [Pezoporus flaviventris]|uniref:LOW QUALITY PROTEIN: probable E3 ubiquitin-protein ligase HERC4 n=1 Tax=Pezoporus flaviventris TaxID=889875 RepID=UPI002AB18800|nr:LOW QUALITY PROTEIN: probable E3 ubiquitin-protein ligase HERC4 [Pezoporus flaviventris]
MTIMPVCICCAEHMQMQKKERVQCSNHDATHRLVLSADGELSEHWAATSADCSKTRLVKELGNHDVVQIACGDQYAMALTRGGELFTWGQNTHGQLGVGSQATLTPQPQLVERLKGIPLAQIAAGGAHSAAVSLSGAVYSWGKNDFGQLGLGDTQDRDCPSYVRALEHWKAIFISCGADHTAALSKEGLVCTFGAGGAGQLGHNSTRNELTPRVVAELWGARVSQVACGREHTLVYVPSLDKVYSFGSGEGQLEDEIERNQLIPLPIKIPVNTGKSCQENSTSQKLLIEVTAGGNRSIVLYKEDQNAHLDGIATLKDKEVDEWISNSSSQHWESIKQNISVIFSSEACINGSFLEKRDKHFKTSKEVSGVDMSQVQRFYEKISQKPNIFQEVKKEIEKLLPSLSSSPIPPENFRVYLILLFLLQGEDDSSYRSLNLLAQAITKLQSKDLQTLECLWSNLETSFLKELVILYQRVSQKNLCWFMIELMHVQRDPFTLHPHETVTLQILQILYQVNSRTGFRVQENNFYVPQVKPIITVYWSFNTKKMALWKLTEYPCVFDMQDKIDIHFTERNALSSIFREKHIIENGNEKWGFPVRRQYLLQDIWTHLNNAPTEQFRKILGVSFLDEEGMDEGGPPQELFSVAVRTLCQPVPAAFRRVASGLMWFPSQASGCEDVFFRIGTLCGMALHNGCIAPFAFPRALYKKLLGLTPTLEDLEELLPDVVRSLQGILHEECDHVLESLDMNFTIMEEGGSMGVVELKKNGANIPVTRDNRKEFVDLYVNYVLNESIRKPFEDFMRGFLRGCPGRKWKVFLPAELQTVLQGRKKMDWHLLEKSVMYGWYKSLDKTIRNFWNVFHKLPEEKKKMFLVFLSGSDRIPAYGLEHFNFGIVDPQVENPDELHLGANTCQHILFLPRYSNKRILKKKLLYAIEHNESFGVS